VYGVLYGSVLRVACYTCVVYCVFFFQVLYVRVLCVAIVSFIALRVVCCVACYGDMCVPCPLITRKFRKTKKFAKAMQNMFS
jgi:hypothetical protein